MIQERYELAIQRIKEIKNEKVLPEAFSDYFGFLADFLCKMDSLYTQVASGSLKKMSLSDKREYNRKLYEDILPSHYDESYGNPVYAVEKVGTIFGAILSFLYSECRSMIASAYEGEQTELLIRIELVLEIYGAFVTEYEETGKLPDYENIRQIIYWFVNDYLEEETLRRVGEQVEPAFDFATNIIMNADLNTEDYLYDFGEYITDNERKTAAYFAALPEETIQLIANTYTEGYRIGFQTGNKDITKKKTVNIRYSLGFERVIRQAVLNFKKMGLEPSIYRAGVSLFQNKGVNKVGYFGAIANKQYEYDHKEDSALYLDKHYTNRKLEVMRAAYEEYKEKAAVFGGPAVMETFGEEPFAPKECPQAVKLSEKQQKMSVEYAQAAGELVNEYIPGDERSFTIIAFPTPEIGERFEEIFDEIIKINTLDYGLYQRMQQIIIDVLDKAEKVEIKGMNGNRTDLTVMLHSLSNPEKETNFENCVADVNIPVGEVFTSPKLTGTNGRLHVSRVFLHELEYRDLWFEFKDGYVTDYGCANFESEQENRKYIKDNVLYHHESLPIGEFAIGTNTTAYVTAKKFHIENKLPILIAEKMGPHFALGDTCYSHEEDVKTYNANGKEIIAKENETSARRKTEGAKAYFNCHTDVTVPYDEISELTAVDSKGERISIIKEGRFMLKGIEELNRPFLE